MVTYDRAVIQRFAENLYSQARTILITWALLGFIAGFAVVASLGAKVGMGEAIGAGALGAVFGYVAGRGRAFTLRLQAQTALCQAQIEENTQPGSARLKAGA